MLHFTKEIDYGLLLLAALAELPEGKHVSLREVSQKKKLPYKFLGKIIIPLKKAGLVESIQGVKGGYSLKKNMAEVKLAEIIAAYKEDLAPVQCLQSHRATCKSEDVCSTKGFWSEMHQKLLDVVDKYTVQDLINQNHHG